MSIRLLLVALLLALASVAVNAQCVGMSNGVCLGTDGGPYDGTNGVGDYAPPQHHWQDNWGAIAIDMDTNKYSIVEQISSKERAAYYALRNCRDYSLSHNHAGNCQIVGNPYANVCVAYVWGQDEKGGQYTDLDTAATQEEADAITLKSCQDAPKGNLNCEVAYHACLPAKQLD